MEAPVLILGLSCDFWPVGRPVCVSCLWGFVGIFSLKDIWEPETMYLFYILFDHDCFILRYGLLYIYNMHIFGFFDRVV